MKSNLKNFLAQYARFSDLELEKITAEFKNRAYKRNQFLLREGDVCKDLIFVEKGCVRLFYLKDDVEISVWFAFQHSSAIEIHSFISETPTDYFLQAIEDSTVYFLPKTKLQKLYQAYPQMQEMMRNFWEDVILNLLSRFTSLQKESAEK
ncbi:MAG: cyclic nucleotide-binding domain-containing protein, partial [Saprospiraceae bacterium]|nr:cyclic nucleotide-binding domain-containing protein [Saprospiraceae bacterium]